MNAAKLPRLTKEQRAAALERALKERLEREALDIRDTIGRVAGRAYCGRQQGDSPLRECMSPARGDSSPMTWTLLVTMRVA
jgi:hypothetical protein